MIRIAAMAALVVAQGQPRESACVTVQQANDMVVVAMPYFIEAAARRCADRLPADAFLRNEAGAAAMAARFRAETDSRLASAVRGFVIASAHPSSEISGDVHQIIDTAGRQVAGETVRRLDARQCASVSALMEAAAPLPPDNVGRLMAALFQLVARGRGDMNVCQ
jgi:hypothetical protein